MKTQAMARQARRYLERAGKYHGYMLSEIASGSLKSAERFKQHSQRCTDVGMRWIDRGRNLDWPERLARQAMQASVSAV